jgi:excisionase family DNA binding protein
MRSAEYSASRAMSESFTFPIPMPTVRENSNFASNKLTQRARSEVYMQRKKESKIERWDGIEAIMPPGQKLTKQEMAARLRVCVRTLDTKIANRELPYYKFGRLILFSLGEVEEALRRTCRVPALGEPKHKAGRITAEA